MARAYVADGVVSMDESVDEIKIRLGQVCPVCGADKFERDEYCGGCLTYKERLQESIRMKKRIAKFGSIQ